MASAVAAVAAVLPGAVAAVATVTGAAGNALAMSRQLLMRRRSSTWSSDCDTSGACTSTPLGMPSCEVREPSSEATGATAVAGSANGCCTSGPEQSVAANAAVGAMTRASRPAVAKARIVSTPENQVWMSVGSGRS